MREHFRRISDWYWKNERRLSSLGLIGGFLFDIFTLTRVDHTLENVWIGFHLIVAAIGIIFINLYEEGRLKEKVAGRAHFWWTFVIQFAFGGLFSVYLVFYTRSASIFASWPFLFIVFLNFLANERLRDRYARLWFQTTMFFLALLFYDIYVIPIIVGNISSNIFLLSGVISLILMLVFVLFINILTPEKIKKEKWQLTTSIVGVFFLINLLYFTDLIPPIPLALKQADVFHGINKASDGNYIALQEADQHRPWYQFFLLHDTIHLTQNDNAYVFSSIFAPASFSTNIVHNWRYFDDVARKWVTKSNITLAIQGGRDQGFRTFSNRSNLEPGLWEVQVETTSGQVIGTLKFLVDRVNVDPTLATVIR
jgi:hypothetical protein